MGYCLSDILICVHTYPFNNTTKPFENLHRHHHQQQHFTKSFQDHKSPTDIIYLLTQLLTSPLCMHAWTENDTKTRRVFFIHKYVATRIIYKNRSLYWDVWKRCVKAMCLFLYVVCGLLRLAYFCTRQHL